MPQNDSLVGCWRPCRPMAAHRKVGVAGRVILLLVCLASPALAYAGTRLPQQVQQTEIKGEFVELEGPPKKTVWRETIKFKNNSKRKLPDAVVTSQPYSGTKDHPGEPRDGKTATLKEKTVTFEIGEEKTVTFDHDPLPNGEKYKSWYTDVYETPAQREGHFGPWVGIGNYAFLRVPAGPGGLFTDEFIYPYPDALARSGIGTTEFFLDIAEVSLPSGWSLTAFGPEVFTLDPNGSQIVHATFSTAATISPPETAFVEFDIRFDDVTLGNSYLGVTVIPTPGAFFLVTTGVLTLLPLGYRYARR